MPIEVLHNERPHKCPLPRKRRFHDGAEVRCTECGSVWRLVKFGGLTWWEYKWSTPGPQAVLDEPDLRADQLEDDDARWGGEQP